MVLQIRGVDGVNPTMVDVVPDVRKSPACCSTSSASPAAEPRTHLSRLPQRCRRCRIPTTSNLNLAAHRRSRPTWCSCRSAPTASVRIFNNQGHTDVVADVVGYMLSGQDPVDPRGSGRSALVAVSHVRHPRCRSWAASRSGRARPRTGASPTSPLGGHRPRLGRQPAGRHRQPHLGLAHPSVPIGARQLVPHRLPDRRRAGRCRRTSTPSRARRSPTWPCSRTAPDNTVRVYNLAGYAHYLFDASAVVLANA